MPIDNPDERPIIPTCAALNAWCRRPKGRILRYVDPPGLADQSLAAKGSRPGRRGQSTSIATLIEAISEHAVIIAFRYDHDWYFDYSG
jgi:hypothetical protein